MTKAAVIARDLLDGPSLARQASDPTTPEVFPGSGDSAGLPPGLATGAWSRGALRTSTRRSWYVAKLRWRDQAGLSSCPQHCYVA